MWLIVIRNDSTETSLHVLIWRGFDVIVITFAVPVTVDQRQIQIFQLFAKILKTTF